MRYHYCTKIKGCENYRNNSCDGCNLNEQEHFKELPYTRDIAKNAIVADLMSDWKRLVVKAKTYGMDILFAPNCTETLELYFHDDYPDTLLVDKEVSCKTTS